MELVLQVLVYVLPEQIMTVALGRGKMVFLSQAV